MEVLPLAGDETVTVKEEFLGENFITRNLKLIKFSIVQPWRRSGLRGARFVGVAFPSTKEATESCILFGTWPMVSKVLERGQELYDTLLNLGADAILLSKVTDQVLLHSHVVGVNHTVDLRSVEDSVIVNFIDRLLKVLPGRQT